jgi:hypothetical protein
MRDEIASAFVLPSGVYPMIVEMNKDKKAKLDITDKNPLPDDVEFDKELLGLVLKIFLLKGIRNVESTYAREGRSTTRTHKKETNNSPRPTPVGSRAINGSIGWNKEDGALQIILRGVSTPGNMENGNAAIMEKALSLLSAKHQPVFNDGVSIEINPMKR